MGDFIQALGYKIRRDGVVAEQFQQARRVTRGWQVEGRKTKSSQ